VHKLRHKFYPKLAAVLVLPLFLAGCATRSPVSVPVRLATVPQILLLPCADPAVLPERSLDTGETVRLWGRDRAALGACRDRHAALAEAARALEGQGRPAVPSSR